MKSTLKEILVNIVLLAVALAFVFRPAVVWGIEAAFAALQSPHHQEQGRQT